MPTVPDTVATANLVTQYRELKANADSLAAEMGIIRNAIQERVEVCAYQDERGHAMMRERKASTSYPAREITRVINVWVDSDVPEVRTCGEMLQSLGTDKPVTTYLEIR